MSLDRWMPTWDARSAHAITVDAPAERVFDALVRTDLGRNPMFRFLMAVRLLPAFLVAPRRALRMQRRAGRGRTDLSTAGAGFLLGGAFVPLEIQPPAALTFGLTGQFWTLTGGLRASDPASFAEPPPPGLARAVLGFTLAPLGVARTRLHTETRVRCSDPATARRFLRYWRMMRAGSGVIRYALLRQVKRAAEAAVVS